MTIQQLDVPATIPLYTEQFEGGAPPAYISSSNTSFSVVGNASGASSQLYANGYQAQGCTTGGHFNQFGDAYSTMGWNIPGSYSHSCWQYLSIQSYPQRNITLAQLTTAGAGSVVAELYIHPDGRLGIATVSVAGYQTTLVVSAEPVPIAQWVLVKMTIFPDPANGSAKIDIYYNPTSITPDDSVSVTGVAIPGTIGQVYFGMDTRRSSGWNISVVTNLAAPPANWGGIVAAFQPNGYSYSSTNFGVTQTANPASASYTSTHTKSVNWGVFVNTYTNAYADTIHINDTKSYTPINTSSGTPGTPVLIGAYTTTTGATSNVCQLTAGTVASATQIIVVVGFGSAPSSVAISDSVGNQYTLLGSEPGGNPPVRVYQAVTPVKLINFAGSMPTPTVTATLGSAITLNMMVFAIPGCLPLSYQGSQSGTGSAVSTNSGTFPAAPATALVIQHNWGAANTWTAPVNSIGSANGGATPGAGYTSAGWQNAPNTTALTMASTISSSQSWTRIHLSCPIAAPGCGVQIGASADSTSRTSHPCTINTPTSKTC